LAEENKQFLDAKIEVERLRNLYREDKTQGTFNLLLMGDTGTGKTFIARTARKPVHIDSFDKVGTLCLKEWIDKGEVVVDTRYEHEDPLKPSAYELWQKEFTNRVRNKYFENFGTYMLDSSTEFANAVMNKILMMDGRAGTAPMFTKDYVPQKVQLEAWINRILTLPCDVIVTGHLEIVKDDNIGNVEYRYMTTGKAQQVIPLRFAEKWVSITKETNAGIEYQIVTKRTGKYLASSSISAGRLETYETPDIKAILKKCGYSVDDKPRLV
jgi:hypothetical protein